MEKTNQELYEIIQTLQGQVNDIEKRLNKLKEWSDLNDYYMQEEIDALTDTVDKLVEKMKG